MMRWERAALALPMICVAVLWQVQAQDRVIIASDPAGIVTADIRAFAVSVTPAPDMVHVGEKAAKGL